MFRNQIGLTKKAVFLLVVFQVAAAASPDDPPPFKEQICLQGAGALVEKGTFRVPDAPSLKAKMISAAEQLVGPKHGQLAVQALRSLGVEETEIATRVNKALEAFLDVGRRQGLSADSSIKPLLAGPPGPANAIVPGHFSTRYNLGHYRKLLEGMGAVEPGTQNLHGYKDQIGSAYRLAELVGNKSLALESLVHMVRLKQFKEAVKTAASTDDALLALAKLSLSEFFIGGMKDRFSLGHLRDATEALKNVRGSQREEAKEMVLDLAQALSTPKLWESAARSSELPYSLPEKIHINKQNYLSQALKLLRQMGEIKRLIATGINDIDYVTEISDSRIAQSIGDISDEFLKVAPSLSDFDEALLALQAVGDHERISKIAKQVQMNARGTDEYYKSVKYFAAANKPKEAAAIVDSYLYLVQQLPVEDDIRVWSTLESFLTALFQFKDSSRIQAISNVAKGRLPTASSKFTRGLWTSLMDVAGNALKGEKPRVSTQEMEIGEYDRRSLATFSEIEDQIRFTVRNTLVQPDPIHREELLRKGEEALKAMDYQQTYQAFRDALDIDGLTRLGEALSRLPSREPLEMVSYLTAEIIQTLQEKRSLVEQ